MTEWIIWRGCRAIPCAVLSCCYSLYPRFLMPFANANERATQFKRHLTRMELPTEVKLRKYGDAFMVAPMGTINHKNGQAKRKPIACDSTLRIKALGVAIVASQIILTFYIVPATQTYQARGNRQLFRLRMREKRTYEIPLPRFACFASLPYPPSNYHICPCCSTNLGMTMPIFSHHQLREMWIEKRSKLVLWQTARTLEPWMQLIEAGFGAYVPKPLSTIACSGRLDRRTARITIFIQDFAQNARSFPAVAA